LRDVPLTEGLGRRFVELDVGPADFRYKEHKITLAIPDCGLFDSGLLLEPPA
jgi:hypothetical protein